MHVFSNNKSQHHTEIGTKKDKGKVVRYPGDVSENESQETILGKGGEDTGREMERERSMDVEGRRSKENGERKDGEGIMRTVRVDISSEERGVHGDEFDEQGRRGHR